MSASIHQLRIQPMTVQRYISLNLYQIFLFVYIILAGRFGKAVIIRDRERVLLIKLDNLLLIIWITFFHLSGIEFGID